MDQAVENVSEKPALSGENVVSRKSAAMALHENIGVLIMNVVNGIL